MEANLQAGGGLWFGGGLSCFLEENSHISPLFMYPVPNKGGFDFLVFVPSLPNPITYVWWVCGDDLWSVTAVWSAR